MITYSHLSTLGRMSLTEDPMISLRAKLKVTWPVQHSNETTLATLAVLAVLRHSGKFLQVHHSIGFAGILHQVTTSTARTLQLRST